MSPRRGVRIGVDVGTVRVGIARCDPDAIMTFPVVTLRRRDDWSDVDELARIIDEHEAIEVVVGLPRHLRGAEGVSAKGARRYARRIKDLRPHIRVAMVDERLSSTQAHQRLRESGVAERDHRAVIDQVAAQVILEHALELERIGGRPPGSTIDATDRKDSQ
ncbi:Holliday junction resolvase RuvX [Actinomyces sp. B33]|uniref:Holliday junction resolvase RuvX n=1 Tax=Actinomyces sp. B33 TaxID=2942131 RepID=UPI0023409333|nr:Holliday junction resolvase RuvX [Actinomyces sp. B33]MDC4233247.1 Holliday junction resolvase RuvX [Actinomyces sp. B33]